MKIAYILPTRDRPLVLAETLAALGALPRHDAQVIIVDNASTVRPRVPSSLANGLSVEVVPLRSNAGAAGRNAGVMVSDPACEWAVMLDDDSAPLGIGHVKALNAAGPDVGAVAAEIWLSKEQGIEAKRESGGLPEVFIGCGVAIRRGAFLDAGGYDAAFGYYVEEYDLAAKLMLAGLRINMDRRFQVVHRKVAAGRDMDLILQRLVRNNGWVMQRYAPQRRLAGEVRHVIERYAKIAQKENATAGYGRGLEELLRSLHAQRRAPLRGSQWDRFTGAAAARASLERSFARRGFRSAAIVDDGKNSAVIRAVLRDLGVREADERSAEALVIGTLSPGPMLDAWDRRGGDPRVICPWDELLTCPSVASSIAA